MSRLRLTPLVLALTWGFPAWAQSVGAEAAPEEPLPEVVVVASTPTRGAELPESKVAGSVQRVGSAQIRATRGATLADALEQNMAGISLNQTQGSPFLPDVSYRGFTASPLLGLPQGLAIYQNGTRLNEPFGDTLGWELIPEVAIAEATLVTGLNPTYGLNALGGALSLRMKNGFSAHGARASASFGSFGRLRGSLEAGFERAGWAVYAGGDALRETGWRDHSPMDLQRLFFDVRRREERYELALNASLARTSLTGNGPLPLEMQEERRQGVFTYPDESHTTLALIGGEGGWSPSRALELSATAFFRSSVRRTLNGDAADLAPCEADASVLCAAGDDDDGTEPAGMQEPVPGITGEPIPASAGGGAAYNNTRTVSLSGGGTLQLVSRHPLFEHPNQLTLGVSADRALTRFHQQSEVGTFALDRGVVGSGYFRGDESGEIQLRVYGTQLGAYVANTLELLPQLSLTLSGRLNWFHIRLQDRGESDEAEAAGEEGAGGDLNGDHMFARFNPAAGVTYSAAPELVLYASYTEANRAPTAAELSCADPESPCRLPNAFLSDPPLEQVVTRTLELGARLRHTFEDGTQLSASLAAFGARNASDLQFVAGSLVGTGYFRNAGTTQRAGLEATLSARFGRVQPYLRYQLLRATFESPLVLPGANHPQASLTGEGAVIFVEPGDRIPAFPMHSARLGARVEPLDELWLDASVQLVSSQYYRGDEANLLRPLPGYATLNASAHYELASFLSVFLQATNLLSTEYATFGLLGEPGEVIEGAADPRFSVPAPPIAVAAGVELQIGS